MTICLEKKTVQDLEQTLRVGSLAHKAGAIDTLRNWTIDTQLVMDAETRQLINKLASEFLGSSKKRN